MGEIAEKPELDYTPDYEYDDDYYDDPDPEPYDVRPHVVSVKDWLSDDMVCDECNSRFLVVEKFEDQFLNGRVQPVSQKGDECCSCSEEQRFKFRKFMLESPEWTEADLEEFDCLFPPPPPLVPSWAECEE